MTYRFQLRQSGIVSTRHSAGKFLPADIEALEVSTSSADYIKKKALKKLGHIERFCQSFFLSCFLLVLPADERGMRSVEDKIFGYYVMC